MNRRVSKVRKVRFTLTPFTRGRKERGRGKRRESKAKTHLCHLLHLAQAWEATQPPATIDSHRRPPCSAPRHGAVEDAKSGSGCHRLAIGRRELKFRRQFAERFPAPDALATVVANHASWTEIGGPR